MKKSTLLFIFFLAVFGGLKAQYTMQVNDKVSIVSPFDLKFYLNAHSDLNKNNNMIDGYRIQIENSSNREAVYAMKAEVYKSFSDFQSYIIYDQPYYKLRMGDFSTRLDARKYLDQVIAVFPTAFIVADKVKVLKKE